MNGGAVIVDDCCRARSHIWDGHRDDGVDRTTAVMRGKLAPIRCTVEVQEEKVVLLKRFAHSSYRIKANAAPCRQGAGGSTSAAPLYWLPERLRAALRLNSELVVNGATQPLLAAEVSLGRLNRDVPEQELNLVEFSAGKVA